MLAFIVALLEGASVGEAAEGTVESLLDQDPLAPTGLAGNDEIHRPDCPDPLLDCPKSSTDVYCSADSVKVTLDSVALPQDGAGRPSTTVFVVRLRLALEGCPSGEEAFVEIGTFSLSPDGMSDVYRWGNFPQESPTDWPEYSYFRAPFSDVQQLASDVQSALNQGIRCFSINDWFAGNGVPVDNLGEVPHRDPDFPGIWPGAR